MMRTASGFESMRRKGRAWSAAASPVVPEPAKKSRTRSPGWEWTLDDAFEDAEGFLGGVAGFLFAGGADDGVPPDVGGGFAAGGFFGADEGEGAM